MGTPTQIYVDPAIAANSGTGTIGDPYGDLQYALNTQVRNAVNGDQFNIKAGTDEIMASAISLATYGTPGVTATLIFRGYTAAANDGGIGGISGGGSVSIFNSSTLDFIHFIDLHLWNCGANGIVRVDSNCSFINCELNTCTGSIALQTGGSCWVERCYLHNCSQVGISCAGTSLIENCFFRNSTNDFTRAIDTGGNDIFITDNIFSLDGSSTGIFVNSSANLIRNNTIYSNAGTGKGIDATTGARHYQCILNNVIVGFSGVGGVGVSLNSASTFLTYGYNKFYNNTTNETLSGNIINNFSNSATLVSSPFTNPAGDDFSVDTQLKAGAYPSSFRGASTNQYLDVGAAQRQEPTAAAAGGAHILGGFIIR